MSQGAQANRGDLVLIAMGGNATSSAGNPHDTLLAALDHLGQSFGPIRTSPFYQTPAFPAGSGPDFVNAACAFHSVRPAEEILSRLHRIEASFGRERNVRWGPRTLDLDLIGVGNAVLPDQATFAHWHELPVSDQKTQTPEHIILPHPRLQDRPFVLVPLADIAHDWVHPVLHLSVAQMLTAHSPAARAEISTVQ